MSQPGIMRDMAYLLKESDFAIANGFSLVIALLELRYQKLLRKSLTPGSNQVDFIVCDHHYPGSRNSKSICSTPIPRRPDCSYPYKELSGLRCLDSTTGLQQACMCEKEYSVLRIGTLSGYGGSEALLRILWPITGENRNSCLPWAEKELSESPRNGLKSNYYACWYWKQRNHH